MSRRLRRPAPRLFLAAVGVGGMMCLARALSVDEPTPLDAAVRRRALAHRTLAAALAPLFPLGMPVGYFGAAYAAAWWLGRRRMPGGRTIIASAWLGWAAHRVAVLAYARERPRRPGIRRRVDSYPSGHTTGVTSLAVATAWVLAQNGIVSRRRAAGLGVSASLIMGFYRVLDDEHWMTDVLGGWLLGGAVGLACTTLVAGSPHKPAITAAEPRISAARRHGRRV